MNIFQSTLPTEVFREVFRREPCALFDRLDEEQTQKVKRACIAMRDEMQKQLMYEGREMALGVKVKMNDAINALNAVL